MTTQALTWKNDLRALVDQIRQVRVKLISGHLIRIENFIRIEMRLQPLDQ